VTTEAAARRWVETWARAWPARDVEAVASLYADGAVFRSQPFRDAHLGPAGAAGYARWAFAAMDELVECRFGEPVVSGSRAAIEYWAIMSEEGREVTLAGAAFVRFRLDGLVDQQRDYWALEEGRRRPPEGWGT